MLAAIPRCRVFDSRLYANLLLVDYRLLHVGCHCPTNSVHSMPITIIPLMIGRELVVLLLGITDTVTLEQYYDSHHKRKTTSSHD